jgi:YHS domain-containing protein
MSWVKAPAALLLVGLVSACAGLPSQPIPATNSEAGVALKGYDPVAYFTEGKPVEGSAQYGYRWNGVDYRFASAENRDRFAADPAAYAPQYGGYCAFAIANSQIADIDPTDWSVVDHKLYLNNNDVAQSLWSLDKPGNIEAGDRHWADVPKTGP